MKRQYEIMIYAIVVGSILIGGLLGIYIIGKEDEKYNFELFFPMAVSAMGGFIIFLVISKWRQKRNGSVPEVDERTLLLMKKYFSWSLYFVLLCSGALLLILFAMGVQTIEIGILIVYMMILFFLVGIGAFITKRI